MISNAKSKLLRSLDQKKYREQHQLFVVEGIKMVGELLHGTTGNKMEVQEIFAVKEWLNRFGSSVGKGIGMTELTDKELHKVSNLQSPQQVIALIRIPDHKLDPVKLVGETVLGLESVRDPGNLGTIIRTADWFGIRNILCTPDSVDLFNPKVIQATMGAIFRIKVFYTDILSLLQDPTLKNKPVYGTFPDGENIYETRIEPAPLVLFGNESKGLTDLYESHMKGRLSIPSFAGKVPGPESLNLAASVAVICSEIKRRG